MSIYATWFMCLDEQPMGVCCDGSNYWPSNDPGDRAPLRYHGSGVLPEANHQRAGSIEVGAIPAHVRFWRDNRNASTINEPDGYDPYVRIGVQQETFGEGHDVVLDREQVRALRDSLTVWLDATEPKQEAA